MTILGVDISKWDGNWDASKAKKAGATFVFIKASQATAADPQFLVNWKKAKDAGLLRGAYHYLDYTKPGMDQANYFADLLKTDPGELPPVIDYELRRTDNNPSAALGFLRDCLDQLTKRSELFEDASIKRPMIYTGPGFWVEYGDQTKRDYWIQFPLWNAHWITSNTPTIPLPWTMWQFWQFTSKGPGEAFGSESLSMDMSRFNGTLNELMEFAGIRIPVVNLNEKFDTLDEKIKNLEGIVLSFDQAGDTFATDTLGRVDNLEDQISEIGGTIADLTTALAQRIAAVEQQIANPGNNLSNLASLAAPSSEPATPDNSPSDQVSPAGPSSEPTTPDNSSSDQASPAGSSSEPATPANSPSDSVTPIDPPSNNHSAYATCTTATLNVRSGPGPSFPMTAALQHRQRVKVINRQNGWAQFEDPAGWSCEAYLSFEQSNSPALVETPQPTTASNGYGICNTSGLNVRGGPGVTYPIVGGLTYGQRIKILSHKTGWAQIETPSGWCNESYLSFA